MSREVPLKLSRSCLNGNFICPFIASVNKRVEDIVYVLCLQNEVVTAGSEVNLQSDITDEHLNCILNVASFKCLWGCTKVYSSVPTERQISDLICIRNTTIMFAILHAVIDATYSSVVALFHVCL